MSKLKPDRAVILAAGKGTRMRELTRDLPKPMVLVQGRPILEHIITGLRDCAGIRQFCLVVGYHAEVVREYFKDGSPLGCHIQYVVQQEQNGTGKAPEYAREFVGKHPFFLSYGDVLTLPGNYGRAIQRWQEVPDGEALISVKEVSDLKAIGAVVLDAKGCMLKLVEKPNEHQVKEFSEQGLTAFGNAGIYIFTPEIFEYTTRLEKSSRGEYELTDALIHMLKDRRVIAGLRLEGEWVDVRDPETLAKLNKK